MPFPCLNQLGRLYRRRFVMVVAFIMRDVYWTFCTHFVLHVTKDVVKAWEPRLLCVCCVASLQFMIIAKATNCVAQVHPVASW